MRKTVGEPNLTLRGPVAITIKRASKSSPQNLLSSPSSSSLISASVSLAPSLSPPARSLPPTSQRCPPAVGSSSLSSLPSPISFQLPIDSHHSQDDEDDTQNTKQKKKNIPPKTKKNTPKQNPLTNNSTQNKSDDRYSDTDVDITDMNNLCPVCQNCYDSPQMLIKHINLHVAGQFQGLIDPEVPKSMGWAPCPSCELYYKAGSGVTKHQASCRVKNRPASVPHSDPSDLGWLPSLSDVFSSYCPTLTYVPATHRQAWGEVLTLELNQVASLNNVEAWTRLFMLPKCVLAASKRGGVRNRGDHFTVTELCEAWKQGHHKWLWSRSSRQHPPNSKSSPQSSRVLNMAIQHARHSRIGKACSVLSSSGLADDSTDTLNKLRQKHPPSPPPVPTVDVDVEQNPPLQLPVDFNLVRVLMSFAKGVGTDGTNFRVSHLLDARDAHTPTSYLAALRSVVNLLLSGRAVDDVREFAAGARLTALAKGQSDIRPIAAGNIFRRLASKCVCSLIAQKTVPFFKGLQFGVSHSAGAEHIIHSVREVISNNWDSEDELMVLKVDFSNAFNSIDRKTMLNEVATHFPDLFPWVQWCYGCTSQLFYRDHVIESCIGVQQGDPLGPFLFCVVLQVLLRPIKQHWGDLFLNKWYLDDGVVLGKTHQVLGVIKHLDTYGPALGLNLNLQKCELFTPQPANFDTQFSHGFWGLLSFPPLLAQRYTTPNLTLLGAPIGDLDFCQKFVTQLRTSNKKILDQLPLLNDPQISLHILRSCVSFSRFVYLARTTPPMFISAMLKEVDNDIRCSLEGFAMLHMSDVAWQQAQLSLSHGGLGLRSLPRHCAAAFVSSHVRSLPRLRTESVLDALGQVAEQCEVVARGQLLDDYINSILDSEEPIPQKKLSSKLDALDSARLREKFSGPGSLSDSIRLSSVCAVRSSAWLLAMPCRGPIDMVLEPDEFVVAIQHRLGLPVAPSGVMCPACLKRPLDPHGHHQLTCKNRGFVVGRHNSLRDNLYRILSLAGMNPRKEQGASWADLSRPADVLADWSLGKRAAFDISVVSPLTDVSLFSAGNNDVVEEGALTKHRQNDSKCVDLGWICVPLIVDSYGRWCQEAHDAFNKIANSLHLKLKCSFSDALSFIFCSLGLVLARQNARSILARQMPASAGSRELHLLSQRVG